MKSTTPGRAVVAALIASVLLNAALVAYLGRLGAIRRLFVRMDLAELPIERSPSREEAAAAFRKLPNSAGEVVFAGDSLMADGPWSELFGEVRNRGIRGERTLGLLGRIGEVAESRPRRVFLLTGANDLASGVPTSQYLRHYGELLGRIRAESPSTEITVLGLLPINPTMPGGPNYGNARIAEANRGLLKLVAGFPGVRFLDLTGDLVDGSGDLRREWTTDGLHLNLDGYLAIRGPILRSMAAADGVGGGRP